MIDLRQFGGDSRDLLRLVLDSVDALVFVKDLQGRYLFVNQRCADTWGRPAEAWIGKRDADLCSPEVAERSAASDRQVLETQAPIQVDENTTIAGEPRLVRSLRAPLRDSAGHVAGVCGIATDVTDSAAAETELRRRV